MILHSLGDYLGPIDDASNSSRLRRGKLDARQAHRAIGGIDNVYREACELWCISDVRKH
ncbi:hypothetical protein D3C80_1712110 [compost metagenome]